MDSVVPKKEVGRPSVAKWHYLPRE